MTTSALSSRENMIKIIAGIAAGFGLALYPAYVILTVILCVPVIIAFVAGGEKGGRMAWFMLPYVVAAAVHPFHQLWNGYGDITCMFSILTTSPAIPEVWLAAASGWLVPEFLATGSRIGEMVRIYRRRHVVTTRIKKLQAEWDVSKPARNGGS